MANHKEKCLHYARLAIKNILEAMQVKLKVKAGKIIIEHKKDSLIYEEL